MAEDYGSSPSSHRRKVSDPLSRLSDISSGSSFNSVGGGSNPGSPRLLPRRVRQTYAPNISSSHVTKNSPILGGGSNSAVTISSSSSLSSSPSPFSYGFQNKSTPLNRPTSNSSLVLMDIESDDFANVPESETSGNFSAVDSSVSQFNYSAGRWEGRGGGSPRKMIQNKGKMEINWQEKCLGLELELHRFKHQASQVKDILQDKVSFFLSLFFFTPPPSSPFSPLI